MKISAISSIKQYKLNSAKNNSQAIAKENFRANNSISNFNSNYFLNFLGVQNAKKLSDYKTPAIENKKLAEEFLKIYNEIPTKKAFSPGRAVLIGDHVDNFGGTIGSFAIDAGTYIAGKKDDNSRQVEVYSKNIDSSFSFNLDDEPSMSKNNFWGNYIEGAIRTLEEKIQENEPDFKMPGMKLYIEGNISGSGLSSSASLEIAVASIALALAEKNLPKEEIALVGQTTEREWAGVVSGLLDQLSVLFGQDGSFICVQCQEAPTANAIAKNEDRNFQDEYTIVVCDTKVKHSLGADPTTGESFYVSRRRETDKGFEKLKENFFPDVKYLADIQPEEFAQNEDEIKAVLSENEFKRCKHVITETDRTKQALEAFKNGDYEKMGKLMYESHKSLKDDYEVSCDELDTLVEIAKNNDVIGSRLSGAGMGGSTVNIVPNDKVESFIKAVEQGYRTTTEDGKTTGAHIFITSPSKGAYFEKM